MLFKRRFQDGLRDGSITLTFRAWSRPQVRAGGSYRLDGATALLVDSVERVRLADVSGADAHRAGFASREALFAELRAGSRRPLRSDSQVYRVAFHAVEARDEPAALARDGDLADEEVEGLRERLSRKDARSSHGPWTLQTLRLIKRHPGVAASRLASRLGRETQPFKADVRKLKALGLTVSHEVGYEISPRGRAYLAYARAYVLGASAEARIADAAAAR